MTANEQRILDLAERAARDRSYSSALRTTPMRPALATAVLRRLPEEEGFSPEQIAAHIEQLPDDTGENVQVGKSTSQAFVAVAIPGQPKLAFGWAEKIMTTTSASSVKMNFGPGKPTNVKIFWGKPEVNTLIEIGGDD